MTNVRELDDLDYEIQELVYLINDVEGICTVDSCFGHNERPCRIWCDAKDIETLNKFIYKYFYNDYLWTFQICLTDVMIDEGDWNRVHFLIESKYSDFPTVNLMVDLLTHRFREAACNYQVKKSCDNCKYTIGNHWPCVDCIVSEHDRWEGKE